MRGRCTCTSLYMQMHARTLLLHTLTLVDTSCAIIRRTCSPVELTETETEYVVTCTKHILPQHVVFQFHITNNMEEHQLENVTVEMESENEAWQEEVSMTWRAGGCRCRRVAASIVSHVDSCMFILSHSSPSPKRRSAQALLVQHSLCSHAHRQHINLDRSHVRSNLQSRR